MAHKLTLLLFASVGLLNAQISFAGPRSHLDDDDHAPTAVFENTKLGIEAHDHDDQNDWVVKGKGHIVGKDDSKWAKRDDRDNHKWAKKEDKDDRKSADKDDRKWAKKEDKDDRKSADKDDRKWAKKEDKDDRKSADKDDRKWAKKEDKDDRKSADKDDRKWAKKEDKDDRKSADKDDRKWAKKEDKDDRKWAKKEDKDDRKSADKDGRKWEKKDGKKRDEKGQWRGEKGNKYDQRYIEDEVQAPAIGKLVIINNPQDDRKEQHKGWKKNTKQIEHEDSHDNDDLRPVNVVNFQPLPQKRPDWDDANKGIDTRNNVNNVVITTYGEVQNPPHLSNPPPAQVAKKVQHQVNKGDKKATDSIFKYNSLTINTDVADEDNSKDQEHQHQDNRKGDKKLNVYYGDNVDSKIYVKKKANDQDDHKRREDNDDKKKIKRIEHGHDQEDNSKSDKSNKKYGRDERKSDSDDKKGNLARNDKHY